MKASKAKEYLMQIRKMDVRIGQRITELNQMRERLSLIAGIDYSKDRIQTSPTSGNKQIEDIVDYENNIIDMIKQETELKHKIIGEIQTLENPIYVDILFRRYVECNSFERIACDMGYVYNYVCTLHGEALKLFEKEVIMNSTNIDVRIAMIKADMKQWQAAEVLGISETGLCRKLRKELPRKEQEEMIEKILKSANS